MSLLEVVGAFDGIIGLQLRRNAAAERQYHCGNECVYVLESMACLASHSGGVLHLSQALAEVMRYVVLF